MKGENRIGSVGGTDNKIPAGNWRRSSCPQPPTGQSVAGGGYSALYHINPKFTRILPALHQSHQMIFIPGLNAVECTFFSLLLWLLMFKVLDPSCILLLDQAHFRQREFIGGFFGKLWGKFGGFVGERVSYARCCGRRVPCCAARVVSAAQTRAFFNQSRPDRRAEHMSVSMERTEGCFLKANIEVAV